MKALVVGDGLSNQALIVGDWYLSQALVVQDWCLSKALVVGDGDLSKALVDKCCKSLPNHAQLQSLLWRLLPLAFFFLLQLRLFFSLILFNLKPALPLCQLLFKLPT